SSAATATAIVFFRKSLRCMGIISPYRSTKFQPSWLELQVQANLNLTLRYHCRGDQCDVHMHSPDKDVPEAFIARLSKGIEAVLKSTIIFGNDVSQSLVVAASEIDHGTDILAVHN